MTIDPLPSNPPLPFPSSPSLRPPPLAQVITEQQGQELADELGLRFLETSAKSNINVEQAFFALASYVLLLPSHLIPFLPFAFSSPSTYKLYTTDSLTLLPSPYDARSDIKSRLIDSAAGASGSTAGGAAGGQGGASGMSLGGGQTEGGKGGCC